MRNTFLSILITHVSVIGVICLISSSKLHLWIRCRGGKSCIILESQTALKFILDLKMIMIYYTENTLIRNMTFIVTINYLICQCLICVIPFK